MPKPPIYTRCPVEALSGVWRLSREPGGFHLARSLPGHLLHLVLQGRYGLRTNGRSYTVRKGDLIYYHESEKVEWLGNRTRVVFYSAGFIAPAWPPLPLDRRVFPSTAGMRAAFRRLFLASLRPDRAGRTLRAYAALLTLLEEIEGLLGRQPAEGEGDSRWWAIEQRVRERRQFRPTLETLALWGGCGRATVVRACRKSTGQAPLRRLRQIRMEEARGLLLYSPLTVGQVAEYLGYPRVHEFSRECARHLGRSPSRLRGELSGSRPPATGS